MVAALAALCLSLSVTGCSEDEPTDAEQRAAWIAAEPRSSSASGVETGEDRCDLYRWAESQLTTGMVPDDVVAAIGEPGAIWDTEEGAVWIWELGTCSLIDYDSYVLTFENGSLIEFRYSQG
jgi:hypothetical protein